MLYNDDEDKLSISQEVNDLPNNDPDRDLEKNVSFEKKKDDETIINLYLNNIFDLYNQIKNEIINPDSNLRKNTNHIKNRVISWFSVKGDNKKV